MVRIDRESSFGEGSSLGQIELLESRFTQGGEDIGSSWIDLQGLLEFRKGVFAIVFFKEQIAGEPVGLPAKRVVLQGIRAEGIDDELEDLRDAVPAGILGRPATDDQECVG